MKMHQALVLDHKEASGGYRIITFEVPVLAKSVRPGQFIHMLIPKLDGAVLRRPFSVYKAEGRRLTVLYKSVGRGTNAMKSIQKRETVSLIGPLGNGFKFGKTGKLPVLVAGGYGVAPLAFLASRLKRKGIVFIGGAKASDVLCVSDFKKLGWDVRIATDDGSMGRKGLVTKILDEWLVKMDIDDAIELFACGPDGMLKAVGERAIRLDCRAWLSLDKHMGCGVGACLACVQKIKRNGVESLMRVCREGPVFEASEIVWE
jgi:dihydroorotate dehydrogenase electron transfer subunit